MNLFRCLLITVAALFVFGYGAHAQSSPTKHVSDALVIPGDFADPTVIYVNGIYYSIGTSSEWAPHFPVFSSPDLVSWKQIGYVFDKKPAWTMSSFWAPELVHRNDKFYVYYTARRAADSISCIGVATADKIEDGFTDHGVIVEHGREAIDPFIVEDGEGTYMTWKAYGLDKRPIELLGAPLSEDGLKLTGESFSMLKDTGRQGLEGQCIIKNNEYYYLFYSVGACCGARCSYAVNVARSKSLKGPYINHPANPLLSADRNWKCPGHGTLVRTPDSSWYYLHHAYSVRDDIYTGRQGLLRKMNWAGEWPSFEKSPVPGLISAVEIADKFDANNISDNWQWDFRHADPKILINKNELCLSGEPDSAVNATGTVITTRPYSGDFQMSVTVKNTNASLKGLAFYGDASDAIGIGMRGNTIELWQVKDSVRKVIWQNALTKLDAGVDLKMEAKQGRTLRFYFRNGSSAWKNAGGKDKLLDAGFLPQWDRSPRPGLHHRGSTNDPACFSNFRILYK
jgi:beta-xylosidase